MDLSSAKDPSSLLGQLIELLRAIKDGGVPEQAAAAVDAIQVVAARSKEPSQVVSTQEQTAPPLLADVLAPESHPASSQQPPSTSASPPSADTTVTHSDAPTRPLDTLAPALGPQDLLPDSPTMLDTPLPQPSPAVIPTSTTPASPRPVRRATVPPQETPGAGPSRPRSRERAPDGAKPSANPQPEATPRKPRNLIVCIDGTSNQFSQKNTNVVELYHRLIKDGYQLTFYNSGIGTYATPSWKSWRYFKQVIYNKIDLAIAWNFEKILLSAYLWLCENYREGDRIYLFGFSRGAYQVRALSAMIESVGLLYKGNQDQIPFAYQLYAETKTIPRVEAMRRRFKETFSWTVTVEFVGVWDTVSSVGFIRDKTLPGTTEGMKHVRYFRHALALHERRVKFLPENAREGLGPLEEDIKPGPNGRPHTKEVWFAGSHSNIGGGAMPNEDMNTFGPALRWMTFEATLAGVRMSDAPQYWEDVAIYNSLTPIWNIFEVFPFARLTYRDKPDKGLTYRPHLGRPRKIQENQLIHETALGSIHELLGNMSPWRARLPGKIRWNKQELQQRGFVEADPYTAANRYLEIIAKPEFSRFSDDDIVGLKTLVSTDIGKSSLRDIQTAADTLSHGIHSIITREDSSELEQDHATLDILLSVMIQCRIVYTRSPVPEARDYARRIRQTDEELARRFTDVCALGAVSAPFRHPGSVLCVAYMPGGDRIVSGCGDNAIRVWNVETGEIVGAAMTGHKDWVWSVAVSADGTKIASGSEDNTIRVWSVETGATIALLEGHEGTVFSVAFSPNGLHVVSGADDHTIRVWDVASGKTVVGPIQGHTYWVNSVAYSPDGSQIVSGSIDGTVRMWNAETGEELWRARMPSLVFSVAYSPDGNRIVAGGSTVHVLDAETGEIVLGPLSGHSEAVRSVAFSPDGTKIASGSWYGTVRLWDAETGEELDVLRGHRGTVFSVAFSPDGKHVASASWDMTVRIWDATGEWKRW